MATNIGTQQDSPKAQRWAELRDRIISLFKRPSEKEGPTKQNASAGTAKTNEREGRIEPSGSEGLPKPSRSENPTEPSPPTTDTPSSAQPADSEPMAEIKAALQRIEEALSALPRIEEALLHLPAPTPTSAATPDSPATPTPTEEHHVGAILLAYVAEKKRWTGLWAHKLLEDPEGKAEQHLPGAVLLARTVLQHGHKVKGEPAKTLLEWAQRREAEPPVQSAGTPSSPSSG